MEEFHWNQKVLENPDWDHILKGCNPMGVKSLSLQYLQCDQAEELSRVHFDNRLGLGLQGDL